MSAEIVDGGEGRTAGAGTIDGGDGRTAGAGTSSAAAGAGTSGDSVDVDVGDRVTGAGTSKSSQDSRVNAVRIFNEFAIARGLPNFDTITAQQFCRSHLIQAVANYLVYEYKTTGKPPKYLKLGGMLGVLSQVMAVGKEKFNTFEASGNFFSVLGTNQNAPTNWYRESRQGCERLIRRRAIVKGDPIKEQATPIPRIAVQDMGFQLFRIGTADAALRRAIIVITYLAAGRGGEAATTTWDLVRWDYDYGVAEFTWSQEKTGKQKPIIFLNSVGGKGWWNMDFYHSLGFLLMAGKGQDKVQRGADDSNTQNSWIFPELVVVSKASSKVSDIIQDCRCHPKQAKAYTSVNVRSLPADASAGGIRRGVINQMKRKGVTNGNNSAMSGQADTGRSVNLEYQDTEIGDVVPGKSQRQRRTGKSYY
jgi:hypothetical protein